MMAAVSSRARRTHENSAASFCSSGPKSMYSAGSLTPGCETQMIRKLSPGGSCFRTS